MNGGSQTGRNDWRVVPVSTAVGRDDVETDCGVLNGLIDRLLEQFPSMTAKDAFERVQRSVKPVCVMDWDLMRLTESECGAEREGAVVERGWDSAE